MFESDDFDQVLSQFEFPEISSRISPENTKDIVDVVETKRLSSEHPQNNLKTTKNHKFSPEKNVQFNRILIKNTIETNAATVSPKHTKRKIITSLFDPKSKRKFPGPAGLLTGSLEETKDENICHMELLSQDVEFTQNHMRRDIFETPLWLRLLKDVKSWNLSHVDPIKEIKQQAVTGNLCRRKAQTVTAFIETIDRTAVDPLIIISDTTGNIKCTLHRDAWTIFSPYIVSEYCALVLWKPTVLTTGSAFKKHYLNITLSNIYAIYSSVVLNDHLLPDGYIRDTGEDYTIIKIEDSPQESNPIINNAEARDSIDLFDGLDSIFSDDIF